MYRGVYCTVLPCTTIRRIFFFVAVLSFSVVRPRCEGCFLLLCFGYMIRPAVVFPAVLFCFAWLVLAWLGMTHAPSTVYFVFPFLALRASAKYITHALPLIKLSLVDSNAGVRRNAAFCAGTLAQGGGERHWWAVRECVMQHSACCAGYGYDSHISTGIITLANVRVEGEGGGGRVRRSISFVSSSRKTPFSLRNTPSPAFPPPCCYGAGEAVVPYYLELLQALHPLFSLTGKGTEGGVVDNAAAAVARMIMAAPAAVPMDQVGVCW